MAETPHDTLINALNRIEGKVDGLNNAIHGEGESPGLKGRLDRVEQKQAMISRVVWAGLAPIGAAVALGFKNWINSK
jgi:hypothetical protein